MARKIIVTSALPYANNSIHIGHLVEYLQTDIWVRFQKLCGNECHYFCADDTHGTPVMISARQRGITPEELIDGVNAEHLNDFTRFHIEFDNYYSTHSDENRQFSEQIYQKAVENDSITQKEIEQVYCENCDMWLPDRFIRGTCPKCKAEDQYGDSCDSCGGTHQPTELIDAKCSQCGAPPVRRKSVHYFFRLDKYGDRLAEFARGGYVQTSVLNKLDEWFSAGLKDWDISRDGPYFGFKIPGEDNKFFYVWLDAPIGYMASCKNYCDSHGMDFDKVWNNEEYELYHFIGKDIMYFHALFWPALLMSAEMRTPNKLFVHGFLTVDGKKMSKSKGTFIKASTYLNHLDPEYLRYYYASKLGNGVDDIDLSLDDFIAKVNSDLVGKLANLASRSGPMISKKLDGMLGGLDDEGRVLIEKLIAAKDEVIADFESLSYAAAVRKITALLDECNRYVDNKQPWQMIKSDAEATREVLTTVINAVKILTIYLKAVLPKFAEKIEALLDVSPLSFADVETILENKKINEFQRLIERVDKEKVDAMIEESKDNVQPAAEEAAANVEVTLDEPIEAECTIDDVMKVDLRVAKVVVAEPVEGANKLLHLTLDIGGLKKEVFAGIAKAYDPATLVGKHVICVANLKPRQMKFGLSEGMILAAGPGGSEVFVLGVDEGAKPGQRVH